MRKLIPLFCSVLLLSACHKNHHDGAQTQSSNPRAQAISVSSQTLRQAFDSSLSLEQSQLLASLNRLAKSNTPGLETIYEDALTKVKSPELFLAYARYLQSNSHFQQARLILEQALLLNPDHDALNQSYLQSLSLDPDLSAAPRQLVGAKDLTALKLLGGGSTLVFRVIKDGKTIAALKPQQSRLQSNYRSEIAAYRLCPLIHCRFSIPRNLQVFIEYNDFVSLYRRIKSNPKSELKDLTYVRNTTDNKDYIHATLKDWVKEYTQFPIEFTGVWTPWLNTTSREELQTTPASSIIPSFVKKHPLGAKLQKSWQEHLEHTTLYALSLQISNMLVFDFLSNNWDRFSGVPKFWGINCQLSTSKLVSIDNGASFPKTANPKPLANLHKITRFSRLTTQSIRKLQFQPTLDFLFPNATPFEQERFATFWAQRTALLNYVDECVAKQGEENTYFFE